MEIEPDKLKDIARGLKDDGGQPPLHVLWAVASLIGDGVVPDALIGQRTQHGDGIGTTWTTIALTGERIVTVVAWAGVMDWGYNSPHKHHEPEKLTARARRITDISSIEVVEADAAGWGTDDIYRWSPSWRIQFAGDGGSVDILPDSMGKREGVVRTLLAKLM